MRVEVVTVALSTLLKVRTFYLVYAKTARRWMPADCPSWGARGCIFCCLIG